MTAEQWLRGKFAGTRTCDFCGGTGVDPVGNVVTKKEAPCRLCRGQKVIQQIRETEEAIEGVKGDLVLGVETGRDGEMLVYGAPLGEMIKKWGAIIEDDVKYPDDASKIKAILAAATPRWVEFLTKLGWSA